MILIEILVEKFIILSLHSHTPPQTRSHIHARIATRHKYTYSVIGYTSEIMAIYCNFFQVLNFHKAGISLNKPPVVKWFHPVFLVETYPGVI